MNRFFRVGRPVLFFWAVLPWLMLSSCAAGGPDQTPRLVGGPCRYVEIRGKARLREINTPPADAYNCRNAVELVFDFKPDDPAAAGKYRFPGQPDQGMRLTVFGGANPPREWVEAHKLTVGTYLEARRQEITAGTCTPVIFSFPALNLEDGDIPCWK
ncbi:MAG: hypothetical protein V1816_22125 [Pseudomonadota bacterium]